MGIQYIYTKDFDRYYYIKPFVFRVLRHRVWKFAESNRFGVNRFIPLNMPVYKMMNTFLFFYLFFFFTIFKRRGE